MKIEEVQKLYEKERKYEKSLYGEYKQNESFNLATFLEFLRFYIDKATTSYTKEWTSELPPWLKNCVEFEDQGSAPVVTYDALIKIMTLSGAALETYANIDVNQWRKHLKEKEFEND